MLALVKKPHTEISIHGEHAREILSWLQKKYTVTVLSEDLGEEAAADSLVAIEDTAYWKEMERNRAGNLLAAGRLKAGLTQVQLAAKLKMHQNVISDYEHGRRTPSAATLNRLCEVLGLSKGHFSKDVKRGE